MPRGDRKYETMCTSCDQMVGVIYTPFNRQHVPSSFAPVPKTSRHKAAGRWCPGSQLSITQAQMIPTRAVA